MLVDHVGLILLDDNELMRFIGRFALVGFSFVLAYNYKYHTSDKQAYKKRLFIWALISQVPYMLIIGMHLNIMWLLLAGLYAIDAVQLIKDEPNKIIRPTLYLTGAIVISLYAGVFVFGIITIVLMYYVNDTKTCALLLISITLMNFNIVYGLAAQISYIGIYYINTNLHVERIKGFWFYAFYPVHIIIIGILK